MRRGEVWTVASGGGYLGKSRPVVIVHLGRLGDEDMTRLGRAVMVFLGLTGS